MRRKWSAYDTERLLRGIKEGLTLHQLLNLFPDTTYHQLYYKAYKLSCLHGVRLELERENIDDIELHRIQYLLDAGFTHKEIGLHIGRPRDTVSRTIAKKRLVRHYKHDINQTYRNALHSIDWTKLPDLSDNT